MCPILANILHWTIVCKTHQPYRKAVYQIVYNMIWGSHARNMIIKDTFSQHTRKQNLQT